jgi:hypothetical protein
MLADLSIGPAGSHMCDPVQGRMRPCLTSRMRLVSEARMRASACRR